LRLKYYDILYSMLDIQQKRKVRSVAYHPVTLVLLGILVVFFAHSTWAVWQKKRDSAELKNISAASLSDLEARDTELRANIANLQTDNGVEAEIRSKFNVAKPGENMVVVVDNSSTTLQTATSTGFWQTLRRIFQSH